MQTPIRGIHHMTAIVNDPQANVDFYTGLLGLRLVKQTVNFDDPGTYHLYYGDELGRPGTIVTFFPWQGLRRGNRGTGQVSATAFTVPETALDYWAERLEQHGVRFGGPDQRFGEAVLTLYDPAGLLLELVARPDADASEGWSGGPVPSTMAIRGMAGITLDVADLTPTSRLLTDILGLHQAVAEGQRVRYTIDDDNLSTTIDLVQRPDVPPAMMGVGSVHHIAWRVTDDAAQQAWRSELVRRGIEVTPVRDRQYFRSIYFREPGGVLFEIATDPPGFTIDEAPEHLGQQLKLPAWLEPQRAEIERRLAPITTPGAVHP